MENIFTEKDRVPIKEWFGPAGGGTCSRIYIDTTNIYDIVDWCDAYVMNPPVADTRDPLVRWNISFYQLNYALRLLNSDHKNYQDLCESLASAALHAIMLFESTGSIAQFYKYENLPRWSDLSVSSMGEILLSATAITRQMVYLKMKRKNRFSAEDLGKDIGIYLSLIFRMLGKEWSIAMSIAMGKLQDVELREH